MKSNVADTICTWLETAMELPFTVYADIIPDEDSDGACLRHDPNPAAERRFIDGSRQVSWQLTFFVRCQNAENARRYAADMTDTIDGAEITGDDGIKMDCEAVTLPQFIEVDAKGYTTYSASIRCTYLEE
ncbi:MAG: minor capsid protein [Spirochaetia bacterium]|nr:minor capsid protein [Spirochaetia bacterium]